MGLDRKTVLSSISIFLGFSLCGLAYLSVEATRMLIEILSKAESGYGALVFKEMINGIIAGGTISVAESYVTYISLISGFVLIYFGVLGIVNKGKKNSVMQVFSLDYWANFSKSFSYGEEKNKKFVKKLTKKTKN